ncbi:HNH endonuclease signature motif containing protein [Burkholderia cenocepacia]|uniref:HNH endonuclease signature motif containing protein n=1 Tax=Burkholderia cenocepacia TaxID=95486 RepID=UPI0020185EB4|nr:HNH endonuclease signature motif containing protein [Burkholderia cenocepacia]MCO1396395.1 HNH endonuclease [Burkholderia cenocepacia]MCO1408969.1 HNH endonuclease [Burkholderia cenocepacia]UQN92056.1 HNH endonuclease [Burkholderia cenocepacia]UQN99205.1 HNH endonuclease [Burkholderia cenocepacia]UQP50840.1 HNH endonuclease [Burkholderia cenocepacia]
MSDLLTQEFARRVFSYDAETGVLTSRLTLGKRTAGERLGRPHHLGYLVVEIGGNRFLAHRIAWVYAYGEIPNGKEIDHINGVRSDNRLLNLRVATRAQNSQNRESAGVYFDRQRNRWRAFIWLNGKNKVIGSFPTRELAREAYLSAKRAHHPFFAREPK